MEEKKMPTSWDPECRKREMNCGEDTIKMACPQQHTSSSGYHLPPSITFHVLVNNESISGLIHQLTQNLDNTVTFQLLNILIRF